MEIELPSKNEQVKDQAHWFVKYFLANFNKLLPSFLGPL